MFATANPSCGGLVLNAAPKAFGAHQTRSWFGSKGIGIAIALRRVGPRRTAQEGSGTGCAKKELPPLSLVPTTQQGSSNKHAAQEKENQKTDSNPRPETTQRCQGGMPKSPPHDTKWILKHLQLGQGPGGGLGHYSAKLTLSRKLYHYPQNVVRPKSHWRNRPPAFLQQIEILSNLIYLLDP